MPVYLRYLDEAIFVGRMRRNSPDAHQFEWDEAKAKSNLRKHGFDFDEVGRIFMVARFTEVEVTRDGDGERRWKRTALLFGLLLTVVFTQRGECVRLISARRANKGEEKLYGDRTSDD